MIRARIYPAWLRNRKELRRRRYWRRMIRRGVIQDASLEFLRKGTGELGRAAESQRRLNVRAEVK